MELLPWWKPWLFILIKGPEGYACSEFRSRTDEPFSVYGTDPGYEYAETVEIDIDGPLSDEDE